MRGGEDEDGRAELAVGVGFCACGCGHRTRIATQTRPRLGHVKGRPVRFLNGHGKRGRKFALERLGHDESGSRRWE
jgi:hypothetical protein